MINLHIEVNNFGKNSDQQNQQNETVKLQESTPLINVQTFTNEYCDSDHYCNKNENDKQEEI